MRANLAKFLHVPAHFIGILAMLLCFPALVQAQDSNVLKGKVISSEDNQPVIGASISIQGTNEGTITDIDGNYSIQAPKDATLVFSFIGMTTQTIKLEGQSVLDVTMDVDTKLLDEVVVVGYGEQKKSHLTGAVSKVTNEKLDQVPLSRVDDALAGQISGVNVQMTNPEAGGAPTIKVRGAGSISFESSPLIVIDGIAVGNDADFLSSLDMNDVGSIEVLKDAASAAIYGSRGANGIIMITTKEGKEGFNLSYNTYVGWKSVPANDYLSSVSAWSDYVKTNNGGELTDIMKRAALLGTDTDWQDVMMDGGMINSHSLSASGGTKKTKFRASLSYLEDEGVLLTDNFQKMNFRLNLNTKINDRVSWGTVINPSYTQQRRFGGALHDVIRQSPWLPLYLDESNIDQVNRVRENGRWADAQIGDYAMERMFDDYNLETGEQGTSGTDISTTSNQNPLAKVLERKRMKYQTKVFANTFLKIKLMDGLNFKQSIGGDFRYTRNTDYRGIEATRNGASDSYSRDNSTMQTHIVTESIVTFNKDFDKHSINAVAGFAFEKWVTDYNELEGIGFSSDYIQTIPAANLSSAYTYKSEEALVSYLSRVNYAYDDKYLVSVSARTDGSSKFGQDTKFGFFPAVSLGWRVSEEAFLADNELISEMKVRFSYGVSGSNSGIGRYDHIGLIAPVGTGFGETGFNALNIANADLGWEKLNEINPGLDMSFKQGQFGLSFDYYVRKSEDLLLDLPVPSITGFGTALVNKGVVENKGFELELRSTNLRTSDLTWKSSAIFTHNKNTLLDFAGADGLISVVDAKRAAEWIAQEGSPIASFYGYVVKDEIALDYISNPFYPINAQSEDIYVKDLNGDGVIDTDDRTILGSPYPDLIWSVSNNIDYKDFDISFMFQGSIGAEVRNISSQYVKNEFSSKQDYTSDFPDANQVLDRIFTNDDVQDADYLSLRNVNIGYTLPNTLLSKFGVSKLRVYVGAQNLLYIMSDNYEGYNPEGVDETTPLTYGYQRQIAPIYRTVSAGLNLSF